MVRAQKKTVSLAVMGVTECALPVHLSQQMSADYSVPDRSLFIFRLQTLALSLFLTYCGSHVSGHVDLEHLEHMETVDFGGHQANTAGLSSTLPIEDLGS